MRSGLRLARAGLATCTRCSCGRLLLPAPAISPTVTALRARHFSGTPARSLAFKWFRREEDPAVTDRKQWYRIISDRRRQDAPIAEADAALLLDILRRPNTGPGVFSFEELFDGLRASARSTSTAHAVLTNELYGIVLARWQEAPKDIERELRRFAEQVIEHLALVGNDTAALALTAEIASKSRQPLAPWKALLRTYRDTTNLAGYIRAKEYMELHKLPVDVELVNYQLQLCNAGGMFEETKERYSSMPALYKIEPDWQTRHAALDAAIRTDDVELGNVIVQQMRAFDLEAHAEQTYSAILSWLVARGASIDSLKAEVARMQQADVSLTIQIINAMLHSASLLQRWQSVEQIWAAFAGRDVLAMQETFSLRVSAAVLARETDRAKQIYHEAAEAGYADLLDSRALQTLLAAEMTGDNADTELNELILETLVKRDPFPITPVSLQFLVSRLVEAKDYERLDQILRFSKTRSDWNSSGVLELVLEQVDTAANSIALQNLNVLLRREFATDPAYDLAQRSRLLSRAAQLREPKLMGSLFRKFLTSKLRPDHTMYVLMLNGAAEMRDLELIKRVHSHLRMDMNLSEHTSVLNTLMKAYARVGSTSCFDVWEQISRGGAGPQQASVSIIIDACTYMRLTSKAHHIWRLLEKAGFRFNDNNWASYVEMHTRNELTEEVYDVLEDALARGEPIAGRTVSTLYNTAPASRERTERWAKEHTPRVWQDLTAQTEHNALNAPAPA